MRAKFSHLCQYVTRVNANGLHLCNDAADAFGYEYTARGTQKPTFVTMCTRHAMLWAKKKEATK